MTNLTRVTGKIFGETASTSNTPKEIGQFGSAKAGTYNATGDVATIQNLAAWSNGWIDAVTPTQQFPSLPEMTGVHKVLSYQNAYLLQKGVAEWDAGTTYYTGDLCKGVGEGKLYVSKIDSNINNDLTDTNSWEELETGANTDLSNLTSTGKSVIDGQWVYEYLRVATNITINVSSGIKEYSLSSYLPNDVYNYEVLFSCYGSGSVGSGTYVFILSDIIGVSSNPSATMQIFRATGTNLGGASSIIPIGTGRKIKMYCSNDYNATLNLNLIAYRRIGTNQ